MATELQPQPTAIERPSDQYFLQEYPITIEFMARGCVISVGCKKIPFTNIEDAMSQLDEYVKNPYESQEKWRKILK